MSEQGQNPSLGSSLGFLLRTAIEALNLAGLSSARQDGEALLRHVLACSQLYLYTHPEQALSSEQQSRFLSLCQRRCVGEPLAYLLQSQEFCGLTFACSAAVLIPRPETELLVSESCAFLEQQKQKQQGSALPLRVLDIGTGSGCIAISIKKLCPFAEVHAWDISPEALAVAEANAERLQADVGFARVDAREAWPCVASFDLIVSNPPYIGQEETAQMDQAVYEFEPHLALFAKVCGLEFYEVFSRLAASRLRPEGRLLLEIGYRQGAAVRELLTKQRWKVLAILPDFQGLDRVVVAVR